MPLLSRLLLIVIFVPLSIFAQTIADTQKDAQEKKNNIIDDIVSDARSLKRADNRSLVLARAGRTVWKSDPKRADELFRSSVGELSAAISDAEMDSRNGKARQMLIVQGVRPQVLETIAIRSADLALQSFYKTRPQIVDAALASAAVPGLRIGTPKGNDSSLAASEQGLEQRLMRMAAEQNPDLAKDMLEEAIKKDLTAETYNLLKKLFAKDVKKANALAAEVMDRLNSRSFTTDDQSINQAVQLAHGILLDNVTEKKKPVPGIEFDPSDLKQLADKYISYRLANRGRGVASSDAQLIKIAEKLSPARIPEIKKAPDPPARRGAQADPRLNQLARSKATAQQILAELKSFPVQQRPAVYQAAAAKMVESGEYGRAAELLRTNLSGPALDSALNNLNSIYAGKLMKSGDFKGAEVLIEDMPEGFKQAALIQLARTAFDKDPDGNKTYALGLLARALGPAQERPQNAAEMARLTQLIGVYATIDADEAFRLFQPLVPQWNELADAFAVVTGFQNNNIVQQGEFSLAAGNPAGFNIDLSIFQKLAQKNMDRTLLVVNSISRPEIRLTIKQQIAETLFGK